MNIGAVSYTHLDVYKRQVFIMIKAVNKMRKPAVVADAPPPPTEVLLGEIRDLLKK